MYKIISVFPSTVILRLTDHTSFGDDPANSDYQDYLRWVAEGNEPEPPDPPPPPVKPGPSIEDRLEAVELIIDLGLMEGML